MKMYAIWPLALDRLAQRTGKLYRFLVASVAAPDADKARQYAVSQDQAGLPWDDPREFACEEVEIVGGMPKEGRVIYQWTPPE